jgi:hypothetical protein
MSKRDRYVAGSDVPSDETLHDSAGRAVDAAYVDAAVADAIDKVRGRGRPSLSGSGESPLLRVRLSEELDRAVRRAAENAGESRSDWVRHVLDEAVRRAG